MKSDRNYGRRFEILAPMGSHVNEKEKKNRKNLKIKTFEKKEKKIGLEIWRIGSFPQNFAWIHGAVFEKFELTEGGTDDGRLRHDSSSADRVKQS